jgi:hypothetical protein
VEDLTELSALAEAEEEIAVALLLFEEREVGR